jgi:two-component system chemotaxis sensor kinase CheA
MDDDILQEFLAESWGNLGQLDTEIVLLEKEPDNDDLLGSIFRTIHPIKGTCGFIGLTGLGAVAHSAENVLGQMCDDTLDVTPDAISLVLEAIDEIKEFLQGIEATGSEPENDNSGLIAKLDLLAQFGADNAKAAAAKSAPAAPAPPPAAPPEISQETETPVTSERTPMQETVIPDANAEPVGTKPVVQEESVEPEAKNEAAPEGEKKRKSVADLSIRVNVDVLDSLMNLVGELVLTRNQLLQLARDDDESIYAAPITHLNRVTTDLQEGVMKTRMQPIGNAWNKLPRLVRDLSQVTGKQIELEMTGAETELDRTVLDAIKDPLTHMVRNSADHGIESPEERRTLGKPEIGKVKLHAFHEGGHVVISIEDDGAGINTERVLRKAVSNGLVSDADAGKMSHNEILSLIFKPGFSTAETVSSVSGRGVGMDVVRTSIERIGGTVDLTSTDGVGSGVRIKIPLTLAIISALVVEAGGESFAIPQLGVVELVRLAAEDRGRIERIHDNEVFRLRDRLLPLIHLDRVMDLDDGEDNEDQDVNIVVVQVGEEQFGVIVSEVFDTEEIVVKPVGKLLKDVAVYQGTTILGDGRVIMILDVTGIASAFGNVAASAPDADNSTDNKSDGDSGATSLLLFDAGNETTMSVPLSLVARLEEFSRDSLEQSGDKLVVQYRGDLLPLLPISGQFGGGDAPDPQPVIVFSEGNQSMGLMVHEIQDIIEERLIIRMQSERPGVLGTAIINENETDVIDTQHYIMQANPEWFAEREDHGTRRVLVVDDSIFFRQLVRTALESIGYRVVALEQPQEAIDIIERGERFDVVVSDIEMPTMDGFSFAKWLKTRPESDGLPVVALSSMSPLTTEAKALDAGFDRYLKKFNSQQLIDTIDQLCREVKLIA